MVNYELNLNRLMERIEADTDLSASNKLTIRKLRDRCTAKQNKPISILTYINAIYRLAKFSKKTDFKDLTEDALYAYISEINGKYAASSAAVEKSNIRMFLKDLNGGEVPKAISWCKVKVPGNNFKTEDMITEPELEALLTACTTQRDRAMLAVLHASAFRVSELLSMNVGSVTVSPQGTAVKCEKSKTFTRAVLLDNGIAKELELWLRNHPRRAQADAPLWCTLRNSVHIDSNGNKKAKERFSRLGYITFMTALKLTGQRAGIAEKKMHPHNFRRSRITLWHGSISEGTIKQLAGWAAGSGMLNRYSKLGDTQANDALAELYGVNKDMAIDNKALLDALMDKRVREAIAGVIKERGLTKEIMATA
ncbi:MAG: tyrosine-type recombinase/integrase [Candidatus Diapherotrites archaeon]